MTCRPAHPHATITNATHGVESALWHISYAGWGYFGRNYNSIHVSMDRT